MADSPVLADHGRRLQAQLTDDLALLMATAAGRAPDDAEARLGAGMLMGLVVAAYQRGLQALAGNEEPREAMLQLIVRGTTGVLVALAGTPYTAPALPPG